MRPASLALLCPLLGGAALAATLQVTPLSLEIDLRHSKAGSVTVTNTGRDAARYRVTVLRVSQDGQETLQPAPEVVLNPPTFTVTAGARQVLRAGFTGAAPANAEATYRVLVQQVPLPGGMATVSSLLSVGVPLYVRTRDGEPDVTFWTERGPQGPVLTARNAGGRRAVLANLSVPGRTLGSLVLVAGGEMRWPLTEGVERVTFEAGGGPHAAKVSAR
ncbi:fimbrial biogenesis chaperone [Deinococcus depolymerans]|uniref:Molecular chaperone n=1 Tax=Deinococcus depolymerans TaxID=392408 RepID=A0ABN1BNS1_9DEIO